MRFCVLASGSKANATFVEAGGVSILIDAGLSAAELQRRLGAIGVEPASLAAILITHEHSDHTRGVAVLARRFGTRVYANPATLAAAGKDLGNSEDVRRFETGEPFRLGALLVHPFSISHDAADPVGFVLASGRCRLGHCTDTGLVTRLMRQRLAGCTGLVLESNHDKAMLQDGPYPYFLKQRISGKRGHLANQDTASFLGELLHEGLRHVVLAHLSETNNLPRLAREAAEAAVASFGEAGPAIHLARQDRVGPVVDLEVNAQQHPICTLSGRLA